MISSSSSRWCFLAFLLTLEDADLEDLVALLLADLVFDLRAALRLRSPLSASRSAPYRRELRFRLGLEERERARVRLPSLSREEEPERDSLFFASSAPPLSAVLVVMSCGRFFLSRGGFSLCRDDEEGFRFQDGCHLLLS